MENYPPGFENHPNGPYTENPREDLFSEMLEFLDENDSNILDLEFDQGEWFYTAFDQDGVKQKYLLPEKYWSVVQ